MRLIPCQSSKISGIAYEPGKVYFYVVFTRGGAVYWYDAGQDAPDIITNILFAASQGQAFDEAIVGLPYVRLDDDQVEALELHV